MADTIQLIEFTKCDGQIVYINPEQVVSVYEYTAGDTAAVFVVGGIIYYVKCSPVETRRKLIAY